MRQLLESGAHFGHRQQRWNPKMAPFIYGVSATTSIFSTSPRPCRCCTRRWSRLREVAAGGGRILFVGTKRQASEPDRRRRQALRPVLCQSAAGWAARSPTGRPSAIRSSRLRTIEETLTSAGESGLTKKELLGLLREQDKLETSLGGIKEMGGVPNLLVRGRHQQGSHRHRRSQEAGHPGDGDPGFQFRSGRHRLPDPGNDDAARAIALYCDLAARAVIDGLGQGADRRRRGPGCGGRNRRHRSAAGRSRTGDRLSLYRPVTRARQTHARAFIDGRRLSMANITATMVKELRDKTGAGMMDCKNALTETGGDMEAAIDWLRKSGIS